MADTDLLPPSSTPLERAIDRTAGARFAALPAVVASLWNAQTCPPAILPWLAWAMSVDEWNEQWGVDKKRAVIAESRLIHQQKGTVAAIRRALTAIGQPDATVIERGNYIRHNGLYLRDGTHNRQGAGGWPTYRVILTQPVTIDMAQQIKRLLASVQRNCITLTAIDYKQAAVRHNGAAIRDGAYTRGVVDTSLT
ncbi:MAG: phage tail protein I [Ferribacterium limneticum]